MQNSGAEVVIMTAGGVGYRVLVSPNASKQCAVGTETTLNTHLVVREDALDLFGFASGAEKELFKNCISVSGIGPRTALHILELGSVEEITLAIGRGDIGYLTKVSGIGKKTAERLVVELKSKVAKGLGPQELGGVTGPVGDVVDALITLGYSASVARDVAKGLDAKNKTSEQLLREALRKIK